MTISKFLVRYSPSLDTMLYHMQNVRPRPWLARVCWPCRSFVGYWVLTMTRFEPRELQYTVAAARRAAIPICLFELKENHQKLFSFHTIFTMKKKLFVHAKIFVLSINACKSIPLALPKFSILISFKYLKKLIRKNPSTTYFKIFQNVSIIIIDRIVNKCPLARIIPPFSLKGFKLRFAETFSPFELGQPTGSPPPSPIPPSPWRN